MGIKFGMNLFPWGWWLLVISRFTNM